MVPVNKPIYSIRVPETERCIELNAPQWNSNITTVLTVDESYKLLKQTKKKLDSEQYKDKWYAYKGLVNPYEMVHVSSNYNRLYENVATGSPMSRSYFKMMEMIHDLKLLDGIDATPIRTAHFAEGPGGFLEATADYRANTCDPKVVHNDSYNGITLKSFQKNIPGWTKAKRIKNKYPQIRLEYGSDNTGNLYNYNNLDGFARSVGYGSCKIATGDGGIDYSIDFSKQEILSHRLLMCQLYGAWLVLQPGGHFVYKLFDMYEQFTVELLWLLSITFDVIYIIKPHTSRPANSERYIVAKGYRKVPSKVLSYFQKLIKEWDPKKNMKSILRSPIPNWFTCAINTYNCWYAKNQVSNIQKCFSLIDGQGGVSELYSLVQSHESEPPSLSYEMIREHFPDIFKEQISNGIQWCKKYKVPLNPQNDLLKDL